MKAEEFINIFINNSKGSSILFDRNDIKVMMDQYKDLHLKIAEEKFEADYKRIKQDYKAQIDLDALCCAVADAEQEYDDKYVKPLIEALEKIQEWQMDNVEIARVTKIYQIADQALKNAKP